MSDALARAFQARARLTRADLGIADNLRPISASKHVDVAVPGYVGTDYRGGGLCLVSVNPAGGKDDYRSTVGDDRIYSAAHSLAKAIDPADQVPLLASAFQDSMPSFGAQWVHVRAIIEASQVDLTQVAYVYVVPCRTRGDAGSKLPSSVLDASVGAGFSDVMAALAPARVIAMDRPSQAAVAHWLERAGASAESIYYTRKRDAHPERRELLEKLKLSPAHPHACGR